MLINENLTITGPGAGELTISGDNASRVFEVAKGKRVALSGLTISHGAGPRRGTRFFLTLWFRYIITVVPAGQLGGFRKEATHAPL